jgi:putative tricarboxylic transport membrane protein
MSEFRPLKRSAAPTGRRLSSRPSWSGWPLVDLAFFIQHLRRHSGGVAGYSPVGPATVPYVVAIVPCAAWPSATGFEGLARRFPGARAADRRRSCWIVGGLAVQMLTC